MGHVKQGEKSPLEAAADDLLADAGFAPETQCDDVLCGNPNDLDAILNGPAWLSRLVSNKMRVNIR